MHATNTLLSCNTSLKASVPTCTDTRPAVSFYCTVTFPGKAQTMDRTFVASTDTESTYDIECASTLQLCLSLFSAS